ncbi:MAG: ABC transporter permease [Granulosicoccus sp.]
MTLFIIMFKEIVDNLRDRQTLFYALLFGPVLLPLLVGGSMVAGFKQMSIDFDEVQTLAVANADRAPNLVEFLSAYNIDAEPAPEDIESSVRYGKELLVLEIPEDFGTSLRVAQPAPLLLHINNADKDSVKAGRRIQTILNAYSQSINALRLQHRGIDPDTFKALVVNLNDVSDEGSEGLLLASLLPFLFIMSMVLGGYYLAIDTTAGERER